MNESTDFDDRMGGPVAGETKSGATVEPSPDGTPGPSARKSKPKRRLRQLIIAGIALCVVIGVVTYGIVLRHNIASTLAARANTEALPQVTLVSPKAGPKTRMIDLPGTLKAWYTAPIYAQVSGYVHQWDKDYGAVVKSGELLATIDTPALDQQFAQAKDSLKVAEANYNLALVTAQRWQALLTKNAVSAEDTDIKTADAAATKSRLDAAKDDVSRYDALENFKRITAPFDGIVTARNTDVGDFVTGGGGDAGSKTTHSAALFQVADVHTMRVFISVPQNYSASVGPDAQATLTFPQFPNQSFPARFDTSAKSFDPISRTVLVELLLPNPEGKFYPGTYTEAHFSVPTDPNILTVPEQSLLFRAEGLQVCLVDANDKVHLQGVKLGHNLGSTVQVIDGLKAGDRLIANPSNGLIEGEQVHVVKAPDTPTQQSAGAK